MMIHFYDRKSMAYTACYQLPFGLETTDDRQEVTCSACLHPCDAEGCRLGVGCNILLPNGKLAVVTEVVCLPVPEVVVVWRGEQVRIPAGEVLFISNMKEAK